jgi:L-alanine-DL-glutamate epimerase-like enolase superfamily enzyme
LGDVTPGTTSTGPVSGAAGAAGGALGSDGSGPGAATTGGVSAGGVSGGGSSAAVATNALASKIPNPRAAKLRESMVMFFPGAQSLRACLLHVVCLFGWPTRCFSLFSLTTLATLSSMPVVTPTSALPVCRVEGYIRPAPCAKEPLMADRTTSDLTINGVEAIYLRLPHVKSQCDSGQDALVVKVTTDAGITGYGEVDSHPLAVKGCIEGPFSHTATTGLARVVLGEDPFRTEYLWQKMYRANIYAGRRGIAIHAMSGIDLALWDIKGKALGLPVWKLLGGGFTSSLRPYASSLFGATPAETGDRARRFVDQGFTAVKFGWDPMGRDFATDIALVREARAGLGPDADLMIDAGLVYDAKTAIQRARAFEPYNPFWFEEPLAPDDYEGYAKLSAASPLRIAAGEEESERRSFLQLMDVGKIDVVQVDLTRCGGFTEAMKIAALAADRGLPIVNHGFTTYLNVAAALHFLASIPNTLGLLEFVVEEGTTLRHALTEPIRAVDGRVVVPDAPGLGIEVNEQGFTPFRAA